MFDTPDVTTVQGLQVLVSALSRVGASPDQSASDPMAAAPPDAAGEGVSDADRIDLLAVLERLKAAAAAAQARVTAAFVESQEQVAQQWRQRARECSDAGDFQGWRAAREQARRASLAVDASGTGSDASGSGSGTGSASGARRRRGAVAVTGVAAQVALARRESPVRGAGHVALALVLTREMPHALATLAAGQLSEWRAQVLVRETAALSAGQRGLVDARLAGTPERRRVLAGLGDRELARQVRAMAYRLEPGSVTARAARAVGERRVTIRPAPDTMAYLTALLPVAQAVAAYAALTAAAGTARGGGDGRGTGQVMADTLVARVTGQQRADAVPVEVQLVMTDRALLAGHDTPAQLPGYGTVPAGWARALLAPDPGPHHPGTGKDASHAGDDGTGSDTAGDDGTGTASDAGRAGDAAGDAAGARVWLRRLYTHPGSGALVAMDSTRRVFDGGLRRFLLARDAGTCRTPWCDAPARHVDHVRDHARGGPTSAANAQGLCVRCNHTKQLPGWRAVTLEPRPHRPHLVQTTTPTGHRYTSTSPPLLPGRHDGHDEHADGLLERHLALALALSA